MKERDIVCFEPLHDIEDRVFMKYCEVESLGSGVNCLCCGVILIGCFYNDDIDLCSTMSSYREELFI